MNDFKVGDYVYGGDWCYGRIMDLTDDGAIIAFETERGGGNLYFDFEELTFAGNPLPYTRISEELNDIVTELMDDWDRLVKKAKLYGMDIRFAPNCENTLDLYFHDDYPDMLLVDKDVSLKLKEN